MLQTPSPTRGALAIAALLFATPAAATVQRTAVASYGLDSNPCTIASPCRSFNAAIAQTTPGGEVVIIDTAGYGPMVIDRAIKIIGPSGVYGGISVQGAASGITTGVLINAGDTDTVTLRGLDIAGVPTIAPLPLLGINVQNAGTVHIEKTSISNFTQDTSACINAASAKPIQIFVNDSFLRECRRGIWVAGSGLDDNSRVNLVVDNTRIEHGLNTAASGTTSVRVDDGVVASFRNSVLAWAGDGIRAFNTVSGVGQRVYVAQTQIARMGNAAIETGGSAGSVIVNVSNSVLNNNFAGLLHGRGQVALTSNVIGNNTHGLVDCGGGAANVTSGRVQRRWRRSRRLHRVHRTDPVPGQVAATRQEALDAGQLSAPSDRQEGRRVLACGGCRRTRTAAKPLPTALRMLSRGPRPHGPCSTGGATAGASSARNDSPSSSTARRSSAPCGRRSPARAARSSSWAGTSTAGCGSCRVRRATGCRSSSASS